LQEPGPHRVVDGVGDDGAYVDARRLAASSVIGWPVEARTEGTESRKV